MPRQWITPLMGFHLSSFYIGDIHSPHHVPDPPWLKVKTELPCLTTGASVTTLAQLFFLPHPHLRMHCLELILLLCLWKGTRAAIQDPDIMKNRTVLKACHVGGGGPRLGTLGPHKAHETAVPSKAFEEGKQAPLFWGTPPPTPQPGWDGCLTRLVSLPSNRRPLALAGFTWNFLQPASSKGSLLLCTEALRLEEEKEYKARNWGVSEDNSPNKKQKNASIKDPWFL